MMELRILSLPVAIAENARRTRRDDHGNLDLTPRIVAEPHSTPCRVCLRDAEVGESVLLLGYSPFAAPHPYRTVGPVFVHAAACTPHGDRVVADPDGVPAALRRRLLSVRAHDRAGRMLDCDVTPGEELLDLARRLLAHPDAHELHVHHARAGCFACRIVAA